MHAENPEDSSGGCLQRD